VLSSASATPVVVPVTSSARPVKAGCEGISALLGRRCDD
jgi:hypothetical protein